MRIQRSVCSVPVIAGSAFSRFSPPLVVPASWQSRQFCSKKAAVIVRKDAASVADTWFSPSERTRAKVSRQGRGMTRIRKKTAEGNLDWTGVNRTAQGRAAAALQAEQQANAGEQHHGTSGLGNDDQHACATEERVVLKLRAARCAAIGAR